MSKQMDADFSSTYSNNEESFDHLVLRETVLLLVEVNNLEYLDLRLSILESRLT